jgi:hypothetical protein
MRHSIQTLFAALIAVSLGASSARAAVYATGFESPTFAPGSVDAQDGWTSLGGPAAANIQSATVVSGTQAARLNSLGVNAIASHPLDVDTSGKIVTLTVDFRHAGNQSGNAAITVLGNVDTVATFFLVGPNAGLTNSSSFTAPGMILADDTWHRLVMTLNFPAHQIGTGVDGGGGFGLFLNSTSSTITGLQLSSNTSSTAQDFYIDNLSVAVVATPEPATLVLLATAPVLLRRRCA